MKKKILLITLMVAMLLCIFAIVASAETPEMYIEFGVRLEGSDNYVTVYTANAESTGNPRINLSNDFYSDVEFNTVVDKTKITGIDFSVAVSHNSESKVNRMTKATDASVFAKCEEIKWFTTGFTSIDNNMFNGWSGLKSFDFGCTTKIDYNAFQNTGFVNVVIPTTVTEINNSAFYGCASLKTVEFKGGPKCTGSTFQDCTALESVDFGSLTSICDNMFKGCTSLKSIVLPSTVKALYKDPFNGCKGLQTADLGQITSMNYGAFANCTSLVSVIIPNTLTTMGNTNFENCTSLKYVKVPNSVTSMGYGTFQGCTALEFAEISNATGSVPTKLFYKCSALKAISIPEGITGVNEYAFSGCTSLKAVYLPSSLTTIGSNSGWERGAFWNCTNLYFVQEPFSVKDENGNWLGNSFVMPSEPSVYYMPSSLSAIVGLDFTSCQQINSCIVFPTTLTSVPAETGAFIDTGKSNTSGGVTYVFLGDMTEIKYNPQDERYKNITFVFANENDTGIDSLTTWYISKNSVKSSNFKAYFCAGKVMYDLSSFAASANGYQAQETDFTKTTYTAETQPHFVDPKRTISTDPTCIANKSETTYCFCKALIGTSEVENTALGHNHDLENGATLVAIEYADYSKAGNKHIKCERCEEIDKTQVALAIIFDYTGFSAKIGGNGITFGYSINQEALADLKSVDDTVQMGFVAVVESYLGENAPLDESANAITLNKGAVIKADLADKTMVSKIDFVLKGDLWDSQIDMDGDGTKETNVKDIPFVMCGYVYANGAVQYIGSNGATEDLPTITYNTLTE